MSIRDALKHIKGDLSVENQKMSSNSHNLLNSSRFGGKFSYSGGRSPRHDDSTSGNRSPQQRKESSDDESSIYVKKEKTYGEHCKSLQKVKKKSVTKGSRS